MMWGEKWLRPDLILQVLTVSSLLAAHLKSNENPSIEQQRERNERISKKEKHSWVVGFQTLPQCC